VLKARLGPDRVVAAGTVATAVALVLFGLARNSHALGGEPDRRHLLDRALSTLNVSAQVALPEWVRGRAWRCS